MQSPSVLRRLIEGLRLLFSPACRFDAAPVGARLRMSDGRDFRIFRRIEIDAPTPPETTFIVRFRPRRMPPWLNRTFSLLPMIPMLGFRGFRSKYWCVDDATGLFQGVYEWQTQADAETYSRSIALRFIQGRSEPGSVTFSIHAQKTSPNDSLYTLIR